MLWARVPGAQARDLNSDLALGVMGVVRAGHGKRMLGDRRFSGTCWLPSLLKDHELGLAQKLFQENKVESVEATWPLCKHTPHSPPHV